MTNDDFTEKMNQVLGPVEQDQCKQMAMQFGTMLAKAERPVINHLLTLAMTAAELISSCPKDSQAQMNDLLGGMTKVVLHAFEEMKSSATVAADEYKCSSCGNVFKKGWSDEDARAEHLERFGREPAMEVDGGTDVLICENCNALGEAHFGKTEGMTKQ